MTSSKKCKLSLFTNLLSFIVLCLFFVIQNTLEATKCDHGKC